VRRSPTPTDIQEVRERRASGRRLGVLVSIGFSCLVLGARRADAAPAPLEAAVEQEVARAPDRPAHRFWVTFRPLLWRPSLSGNLLFVDREATVPPVETRIDVEDDLDAGSAQNTALGEIDFRFGKLSDVWISGYAFDLDAQSMVQRDFQFGDVVFSANGNVITDFRLRNVKLQYGLGFGDLVENHFRINFVLGANYYNVRAFLTGAGTVNGQSGTVTSGFDEEVPVPLLGLHAEFALHDFALVLDGSGLGATIGDYSGSFIDLTATILWRPIPHGGILAGYRYLRLQFDGDIDNDTYDIDVTLDGFFVGLELRF